jgi:DNA-binding transcriptional ArsR family regulator/uncharacterized protein YndB with AHSA1/START domain
MSPALATAASSDPLDHTWRALGDPTRRAILDLLRIAPRTTGELASAFPTSRYAVMKHLDVLVGAGFVVVRRRGRERWNHLNPVPLQQLYERWVRPYEALWAASLIRFRDAAERPPQEPTMPTLAPTDRTTAGVLTVALEIPIAAPVAHVWQMLTEEAHRWWPRDFYASTNPIGMRFEARLGGRLYEESGNGGGVVWYTVIALDPGRSIDLAGHLTAAFGGPSQTLLRLALREQGANTVLEVTDAVVGNVSDRTPKSLEDGWRMLFEGGFKTFAESGQTTN